MDFVISPIENEQGQVLGTIKIDEDGNFNGRFFKTTSFAAVFGEMARIGYTEGIILKPKILPAHPSSTS